MAQETDPPRPAVTAATSEAADGGIDVNALVHGLRKHWPIVIALSIVCTAIGLLYSKAQPRIYQSSTLLNFDPNPDRPLA